MNNETLNRLNAFVADYKKESEDKDAIIKQQNQTLLHISAELEAIKQYDPLDRVLVSCSIENISAIIKGETKPLIDDDCVGCAGPCMVVDVAAKLQKELDMCHQTIKTFKILETRETDRLHKTIKQYKDENVSLRVTINDMVKSWSDDRATIEDLNSQLTDERAIIDKITLLRVNEVETRQGLEAELSALKDDSAVLMKVVDEVKEWIDTTSDPSSYTRRTNAVTLDRIAFIIKDYLDAPEGPPETPIDEPQEITIAVAFLELP